MIVDGLAYVLIEPGRPLRAERRGWQHPLGARLDELEALYVQRVLESHDGNEGIEAFIARRAPVWKDA